MGAGDDDGDSCAIANVVRGSLSMQWMMIGLKSRADEACITARHVLDAASNETRVPN
jgi:hypothetical protein